MAWWRSALRRSMSCSPKRSKELAYQALPLSANRSDCGVRALEVCFDLAYAEAHDFLKAEAGLDEDGMEIQWLDRYAAEERTLNGYGVRRVVLGRRLRVKRRQRLFTEGRWLIGTPGHIFAIKDGVIYDTLDLAALTESLVCEVWQVFPQTSN